MDIAKKIRLNLLGLPRVVKRSIVIGADICSVALSVWLAYYMRIGEFIPLARWTGEHYPLPAVAIGLIVIPLFYVFGLYRLVFRFAGNQSLLLAGKAIAVYGVICVSTVTVFGIDGIPRTIGVIQPLTMFMIVALSRLFMEFLLGNNFTQLMRRNGRKNVLIYGAGMEGRELAKILLAEDGAHPVGFIDDDATLHGQWIAGLQVFPRVSIDALIVSHSVKEILLALPNIGSRRAEIVDSLSGCRVKVRTLPSYADLVLGRASALDVRDLSVDEMLGRNVIEPDSKLMAHDVEDKVVLVTGAGGSIGGELCRQIIWYRPRKLLLLEHTEFTLYQIYEELNGLLRKLPIDHQCQLVMILGSVTDAQRIESILKSESVATIYHAAAYKHVPIVEDNLIEGIRNNVFGTHVLAQTACKYKVKKFVLISTDKAVRPTSIMGASKRLAEMVLQSLCQQHVTTTFAMVRFGNVLNSSGSVVPLFRRQIHHGGPLTLTHRNVTRYFMTITEAAQLVIQAGAMTVGATARIETSPVYLLDMGEPVRIHDLAVRMIELSGFNVANDLAQREGDIEIQEIGLRPGEKLHEELLIGSAATETSHPKIKVASEGYMKSAEFNSLLQSLGDAIATYDAAAARDLLEPHFCHLGSRSKHPDS